MGGISKSKASLEKGQPSLFTFPETVAAGFAGNSFLPLPLLFPARFELANSKTATLEDHFV